MRKDKKTIGIRVRFWTNDLEVKTDKKVHSCWDSGVVHLEANEGKGIKSDVEPFLNYEEIDKAIAVLLRRAKIVMVKNFRKGRL